MTSDDDDAIACCRCWRARRYALPSLSYPREPSTETDARSFQRQVSTRSTIVPIDLFLIGCLGSSKMPARRTAIGAASRAFIIRWLTERHRSIFPFHAAPRRVALMVSDVSSDERVGLVLVPLFLCYSCLIVYRTSAVQHKYERCCKTWCESSMPLPSRHLRSYWYRSVALRRRDVALQFLSASPELPLVGDVPEGRTPLIRCRLIGMG